jgi:hypothetical protein
LVWRKRLRLLNLLLFLELLHRGAQTGRPSEITSQNRDVGLRSDMEFLPFLIEGFIS